MCVRQREEAQASKDRLRLRRGPPWPGLVKGSAGGDFAWDDEYVTMRNYAMCFILVYPVGEEQICFIAFIIK